ncbi:MAG: hypothetical protein K9M57_02015 [Phycisphaerae bacterium]|nr:hypothetical protein [Phycisphaerae bacterium]
MFKRNGKAINGLILVAVMTCIPCIYMAVAGEKAAVASGGKKAVVSEPVDIQAGDKVISDFMATVEILGEGLEFDHNGDGAADMVVYLLKTSRPDLKTDYYTVSRAVEMGDIVVREDPRNYVPGMQRYITPAESIRGPNLVAQVYRPGGGGGGYFQGGQGFTGGGQNRGFGNSGIMGGGGYGGIMGGGGYDQMGYASRVAEQQQTVLDVFCFEKRRVIQLAMKAGSSDLFVNTPMASPSVRKELVMNANQSKVDEIVAAELKRRNIFSPTLALHDIFNNPVYGQTLQWYQGQWRRVLAGSKNVSGMICTDGNGNILCADIYASPKLFKKMLPELLQSSAIEACTYPGGENSPKADVEGFLAKMKGARSWSKDIGETYIHTSSSLVSEAVLFAGAQEGGFVHLEAYRR